MRKLKNSELNRKSVEEFKKTEKFPFIIILDNVRSLNNIGSVFRTADGFLIKGVYLCGITATPPHKDIHKTALGATESVRWEYRKRTREAVAELKEKGYRIIAVEQVEGAVSLDRIKLEKDRKYALVLGHEVRGVDQDVVNQSDICLEVPQFGTKHSLNISVAAGIVIWEVFRQFPSFNM